VPPVTRENYMHTIPDRPGDERADRGPGVKLAPLGRHEKPIEARLHHHRREVELREARPLPLEPLAPATNGAIGVSLALALYSDPALEPHYRVVTRVQRGGLRRAGETPGELLSSVDGHDKAGRPIRGGRGGFLAPVVLRAHLQAEERVPGLARTSEGRRLARGGLHFATRPAMTSLRARFIEDGSPPASSSARWRLASHARSFRWAPTGILSETLMNSFLSL
jgi:hypothetical protein